MYLWNETPGNKSMLALRAARFNAVIPLIDKHVNVSSLSKQFATILRIDVGSSLVGAAAAIAKIADRTMNAFILYVLDFFSLNFTKKIQTDFFFQFLGRSTKSSSCSLQVFTKCYDEYAVRASPFYTSASSNWFDSYRK